MHGSFDAFEYFAYLKSRWTFIAGCCLVAIVLSGGITLLLPKRYTATASILIDPPGGSDPRGTTAVSPIYLESLKTYERFAAGDSLFVRAIERFKLREEAGSTAADALKRRVLKVTKPRDTKLLEISVTWADPRKAQAVTQFIAEETVDLSRSLARQSDDEFTTEARRQAEAARARLDRIEKDLADAGKHPTESLRAQLEAQLELKARLQREVVSANIDSADYAAQEKTESNTNSTDAQRIRRDLAGMGARVQALRRELESIDRDIAAKETELGQRQSRWDKLSADRRTARAALDAATTHVNEAELAAGARGERLKIIDPGIVPQRPSSPNVALNILAALLVALSAAVLYQTIAFGARFRSRPVPSRPVYR